MLGINLSAIYHLMIISFPRAIWYCSPASLIKQEFLFFSLQAVEGCSRSRSRTSSMGVAVSCSAVVAGAATWNAEAAAVLGPM